MYIDLSIQIRQRYGATAKTFYDAGVVSADFSDPVKEAENINNWVSNATRGNIDKMIDDGGSASSFLTRKVLLKLTLFFSRRGKGHGVVIYRSFQCLFYFDGGF